MEELGGPCPTLGSPPHSGAPAPLQGPCPTPGSPHSLPEAVVGAPGSWGAPRPPPPRSPRWTHGCPPWAGGGGSPPCSPPRRWPEHPQGHCQRKVGPCTGEEVLGCSILGWVTLRQCPPPKSPLLILTMCAPQFRWGKVRWDPPQTQLPATSSPNSAVEGVRQDPPNPCSKSHSPKFSW